MPRSHPTPPIDKRKLRRVACAPRAASGGDDRRRLGAALLLSLGLALYAVAWSGTGTSRDLLAALGSALAGGAVAALLVTCVARRSRSNPVVPAASAVEPTNPRDTGLHVLKREHELMVKVLFEHSSDALLVCSPDGTIQLGNPAAMVTFEASALMRGRRITDVLVVHAAMDAPQRGFPVADGEYALRRKDSAPTHAAVSCHPVTLNGEARVIVRIQDLTDLRRTQEKIAYLASFDSLTGLPNRALFRDRLSQAMERARRSGQPMALMFLDLDRFKVVNDSLGHEVGDRLLCHVARVLTGCLRSVDSVGRQVGEEPYTLSRLGGDEFTIIAENLRGAEDAALVARRVLEALATPFAAGEEEVHISASIGISMYPTDDVDMDGMIRHTDMAMYRAKSLGRNTFSFFSDDLNAAIGARLSLEGALRRAIERSEFCLHYQPKADLKTGRVTGAEALIRWHCPGQGMVPPDRFIDVLEDTGLILQVGAWVIRAACAQLAAWDAAGLPRINLAVNLSARQMRQPYLSALVEDTLRESGLDPTRLEMELTESLLMEDTEVSRSVLASFSRIGVRLAIDDFGTGHSSLAYLRRLDVDTVKIDRSFVRDIPQDPEGCAIATAVIALGHSLQMKVVAEGVETQEQADFLRDLGCDEMQGWLLARAQPPEQFAHWLADYHLEQLRSSTVFGADSGPITLITIPETAEI